MKILKIEVSVKIYAEYILEGAIIIIYCVKSGIYKSKSQQQSLEEVNSLS